MVDQVASAESQDVPTMVLPTSSALLDAFNNGFQSATDAGLILDTAAALALHHQCQWAAEDVSRDTDDVSVVAQAKRQIDELNRNRIKLVSRIDTWIDQHLAVPAWDSVALHTETVGSVIDRLAISWVRAHRLGCVERDAKAEAASGPALRQLGELACAYDDLVRDVLAGTRRLPVWRALKRYGTAR